MCWYSLEVPSGCWHKILTEFWVTPQEWKDSRLLYICWPTFAANDVDVFSAPQWQGECLRHGFCTRIVSDNEIDPMWKQWSFLFSDALLPRMLWQTLSQNEKLWCGALSRSFLHAHVNISQITSSPCFRPCRCPHSKAGLTFQKKKKKSLLLSHTVTPPPTEKDLKLLAAIRGVTRRKKRTRKE